MVTNFHFFGVLGNCQIQRSPGRAFVHHRMDPSSWRASVHQRMDSSPGRASVHRPMDCMARRPKPSKISQDDLQNPKKWSQKSPKLVSKIPKIGLKNLQKWSQKWSQKSPRMGSPFGDVRMHTLEMESIRWCTDARPGEKSIRQAGISIILPKCLKDLGRPKNEQKMKSTRGGARRAKRRNRSSGCEGLRFFSPPWNYPIKNVLYLLEKKKKKSADGL